MPGIITKSEKKAMIENIKRLNRDQMIILVKLLMNNKIPYDKNARGIYVMASNIDNESMTYMKNFIDSCIVNMDMESERYKSMEKDKKYLGDIVHK